MDGYQFARAVRADPETAGTAVIFYTASYDDPKAIDLARDLGVTLLSKPSEPAAILTTIERLLDSDRVATTSASPLEFDRRHAQLVVDKLHEKAAALEAANTRLEALVAELRSEVEHRRRAERAAAEQRNWLRVVLESIGDAVIATDAGGRVSLMNPRAERLTGWPQADAANRPLEEVFRIINEESRVAVENPVSKVLRLGTVQGLANHTLLIARDGAERPIDDCAAPIRNGERTADS
jgi:PAS domain S-box-containing protein